MASTQEQSDTHFFNSFSVVLGILIVFAICLFAAARVIGHKQLQDQMSDPLRVAAVETNIAPFSHEAIAGKDNSALLAIDQPKSEAPAADIPKSGEDAFKQVCSGCHALGINGAPKIGDHAIGGKGNMPARGGTNWPDATIRSAVDYMVSLNK